MDMAGDETKSSSVRKGVKYCITIWQKVSRTSLKNGDHAILLDPSYI